MFSNLASYIFGGTIEEPQPLQPEPQPAVKGTEEEEWVLVGEAPAPMTLGSLCDIVSRPITGSTGSSNPPSDTEDMVEVVVEPSPAVDSTTHPNGVTLTRGARRLTVPFGSIAGPPALADIRNVRAAQAGKRKESGKQLSAKSLDRRNKLNHVCSASRKAKTPNMSLKASGASRHLKQC